MVKRPWLAIVLIVWHTYGPKTSYAGAYGPIYGMSTWFMNVLFYH